MTEELKQYIERHKALFWYTPENKKEHISDSLLIENILNYGTLDDVRELIQIMGINHVANVFFSAKDRKKLNYYPEIYNFFYHVFAKYAPQYS
ncbi:MAG: hypothetical protein RBS73_15165 [Prolixibacteraceae bacterium]|jgi:hypothetical protein|nr:hypothetical protein [Prolixibacteraceae bacterium]